MSLFTQLPQPHLSITLNYPSTHPHHSFNVFSPHLNALFTRSYYSARPHHIISHDPSTSPYIILSVHYTSPHVTSIKHHAYPSYYIHHICHTSLLLFIRFITYHKQNSSFITYIAYHSYHIYRSSNITRIFYPNTCIFHQHHHSLSTELGSPITFIIQHTYHIYHIYH